MYEYKIVPTGVLPTLNDIEEYFNSASEDGWELVAIADRYSVFKRPR